MGFYRQFPFSPGGGVRTAMSFYSYVCVGYSSSSLSHASSHNAHQILSKLNLGVLGLSIKWVSIRHPNKVASCEKNVECSNAFSLCTSSLIRHPSLFSEGVLSLNRKLKRARFP